MLIAFILDKLNYTVIQKYKLSKSQLIEVFYEVIK